MIQYSFIIYDSMIIFSYHINESHVNPMSIYRSSLVQSPGREKQIAKPMWQCGWLRLSMQSSVRFQDCKSLIPSQSISCFITYSLRSIMTQYGEVSVGFPSLVQVCNLSLMQRREADFLTDHNQIDGPDHRLWLWQTIMINDNDNNDKIMTVNRIMDC